jgi:hypothetical protein
MNPAYLQPAAHNHSTPVNIAQPAAINHDTSIVAVTVYSFGTADVLETIDADWKFATK